MLKMFVLQRLTELTQFITYGVIIIIITRPQPAYGRQGLDSDPWARIQFKYILVQKRHVTNRGIDAGPQLTSFDQKNVT